MSFDDILLGLIVLKARTGYELKKWLDIEGVFIRANSDQAQIYRTLRLLVRRGHAEFRSESRPGGPQAKICHATADGLRHLLATLTEPYQPPARWQESDFSARLLFLVLLHPPAVLPMLAAELELRRGQRTYYRSFPRVYDRDSDWVDVDADLVGGLLTDLDAAGRAGTDTWIESLEHRITSWSPVLVDAPSPLARAVRQLGESVAEADSPDEASRKTSDR